MSALSKLGPVIMCLMLFTSLFIASLNPLIAQSQEWSEITVNQLKMTQYSAFPDVPAIMIFDVGDMSFNQLEGWQSRLERHVRIHILTEEGKKYAEQAFAYYATNRQEQLIDLQAQTFNLEGDNIIIKKVKKDEFFIDKVNENVKVVKFAFPDVKPGSVIEFKYSFISKNIFSPRPWYFQHEIPTLYSQLHAMLPDRLSFTYVFNGSMADQLFIPVRGTWQLSNIPAIKEEPYVTTIDDYRQNIKLQLDAYVIGGRVEKVLQDWPEFTEDLLGPDGLAKTLKKSKAAKELASTLTADIQDPIEKLKVLYNYVRDHVEWDGEDYIMSDEKLDDILEKKKGTSSEMNLLLSTMLNTAEVEAYPLLISTRAHGQTIPAYPLLSQFNRIICYSKIDEKEFFLNTINPRRPYNLPAFSDLNHIGWLLDLKEHRWVDIPRTYTELQSYYADISLEEDGQLTGKIMAQLAGYDALTFRSAWAAASDEDEFWTSLIGSKLVEGSYSSTEVNRLEEKEKSIHFNFELDASDFIEEGGDYIYINPMLMFGITENPFLSPERNFPIDFGNLLTRSFILKLTIPEDYEIESIPESVKVRFPGNHVRFEFGVNTVANTINLRSTFLLKDSYFLPEAYPAFKELYDNIIKKHKERIVLRKKDNSND